MVVGASTRGTAWVPKNPKDEGVSVNHYKVHPPQRGTLFRYSKAVTHFFRLPSRAIALAPLPPFLGFLCIICHPHPNSCEEQFEHCEPLDSDLLP
jgi:hypothetical protein